MPTFAISTLGCKVNNYESEGYEAALIEKGYTEVDFKESADVYIINTCTVTNSAASKSRQKIHAAHKVNPNGIIAVVGCYVQTSAEDMEEMNYIDILVGSDGKSKLADTIDELVRGVKVDNTIHNARLTSVFEALPIKEYRNQTRAFLKVQDGCNQFCSYCIIPFARGKERSLARQDIVNIAKDLVANGHIEIVLTGIHTGRYGLDLQSDLVSLIKDMLTIDGLERIRLSSIEITEVSDELLELIATDKRVACHLHIPIQSGSNAVLKRMKRPYTIEEFKDRVNYIRNLVPEISISSDLIAGFVDESEEEYQETLQTIKDVNFSFLHVFPYSKRDGTAAANMSGHLRNDVKKARAKEMIELSDKLLSDYQSTWINKEVEVVVESFDKGMISGHSSEYLKVSAVGENCKLAKVLVRRVENGNLVGEIVEVIR